MDITKLLLLGGAAFLGYEFFLKPQSSGSAPSDGGPGIQPGLTPPIPQPTVDAQTTQSMIQSLAARNGFQVGNVDDWNWYYLQVRGVAPPSPDTWGINEAIRARQMTFPEYWAIASSNGLSGRSGYIRGATIPSLAIMEAQ